MDDVIVARALHVLAIVLWIGGVGFVTTVVLPSVRDAASPEERLGRFDTFEHHFAWQARIATLVAGLTGFYMTIRLDLWDRFSSASFWWMHAMVLLWLVFTVMLFAAEPLILHRWLRDRARADPEGAFRVIEWGHRVLLTLSLITIAGAVAGSQGLLFFR